MENELTDFLRRIPWANRTLLENFFGVGSFDKMLAQNSPCIDPKDIIQNRKILLVNTRMSELGSEMSDFLGSFIISLILKEISRQGEHEAGKRILFSC